MRGVSEVIAIILILMITISIAGLAYTFMSSTMASTTSAASSSISTTTTGILSAFTIESMSANVVYVRNVGQTVLTNISAYIDDLPVMIYDAQPIAPGEVGLVEINSDISAGSVIKISTQGATAIKTATESYIGYAKILELNFDEGSGTAAHDLSGNGNDGFVNASGKNQLVNPGFENGKTGWGSGSASGWDIVSDEKYEGSYSSRFQSFLWNDTSSNSTGSIYINVLPNVPITFSMYSKGSNILVGSSSWYKAYSVGRWTNSTNTKECGAYCIDMNIGNGVGTWNWKRTSITHTPTIDTTRYTFYFGLIGNSSGTLWTDAVQLEFGSAATDYSDSPWESGWLSLDGYNDYVLGTISEGIPAKLNVTIRLKYANGPNAIEVPISLGSGSELMMYVDSSNALYLKADGKIDRYIDTIANNTWYEVTFGYNRGSYFAIVDGQEKWRQAAAEPTFSSSIYSLSSMASNSFFGSIDYIRIYNSTK